MQDEKRQHAIDHPGYQYQPRKPSEKKKRMTKNKLAKLAARSGNTDATTDATSLPAQQSEQITVDTLMPPYQNTTSQITNLPGVPAATFNVVPDAAGDDGLRAQLDLLNSQQLPLPMFFAGSAAVGSVPLVQGEQAYESMDVAGFTTYDAVPLEWPSGPVEAVEEARTLDPYAEQDRQDRLGGLFDFVDFEPTESA